MVSDSDGYNYTFVVCGNLSSSHCGNGSVGEFALWYIFKPVKVPSQQLMALGVNHQEMYAV